MSFLDESVKFDQEETTPDDQDDQDDQDDNNHMEKKIILMKKLRDLKLELTQTEDEETQQDIKKEIEQLTERLQKIDPIKKEETIPPSSTETEKETKEKETKDTETKKDIQDKDKSDDKEKRKTKSWQILRSATSAQGFGSKLLQTRHEKNKKAVQGFEDRYQELVLKMGTEDLSRSDSVKSEDLEDLDSSAKHHKIHKREKPHPRMCSCF